MISLAKDEGARIGLSDSDVAAAVAFREKSLKERAQQQQQQQKPPGSPVVARDTLERQADEAEEADDEEEHDADERTPFLKGHPTRRKTLVEVETSKPRALSINPLAPSSAFDETLRDKLKEDAARRAQADADEDAEDERHVGPSDRAMRDSERLLERHWTAPPGKKIAVPVRIEPKVYFATERTFLVCQISVRCSSSSY